MSEHRITGDWKVGDTIIVSQRQPQAYECIGSKPYTRRDGTESAILTWQGECSNCGEPYTFTRGRFCFEHVANCQRCRARFTPSELARRGR